MQPLILFCPTLTEEEFGVALLGEGLLKERMDGGTKRMKKVLAGVGDRVQSYYDRTIE